MQRCMEFMRQHIFVLKSRHRLTYIHHTCSATIHITLAALALTDQHLFIIRDVTFMFLCIFDEASIHLGSVEVKKARVTITHQPRTAP